MQPDNNTLALKNAIARLHLRQLIKDPTRHIKTASGESSTIIDLIITNAFPRIKSSGVAPYGASDHDVIYVELKHKLPNPVKTRIRFRSMKTLDKTKFIADLSEQDWSACITTDDVDIAVERFNSAMSSVIEKHCPSRVITVQPRNNTPWLSDELRKRIKERNRAKKRAQHTGLTIHWDIYRDMRNSINTDVKRCKILHYRDRMAEEGHSKKRLWSLVNEILGRNSNLKQLETPDREVLNYYFAGISTTDNNRYHHDQIQPPGPSCHELKLAPVTPEEIISTIYHLPKKSSEGTDGINTELLQTSLVVTLPAVMHIINLSISTSKFPEKWKEAIITPIFKNKGQASEPNNYRPIAILSVLSRVAEKVVLRQLSQYLEEHHILPTCQHAFRKRHSTETALLEVTDTIWKARDIGHLTTNILLDLSKAFDKVQHKTLLSKMAGFGITDMWFKTYLEGRNQAVKTSGVISNFLPTNCGVPQGSCLGPVLFSIYTNDLPQQLKSRTIMYADDTQLLRSYKVSEQHLAKEDLQTDLDAVVRWMNANHLTINATKTQVITFGTHQQLNKISSPIASGLKINDSQLETAGEVNNLGIIMDPTLSWKPQLQKLRKKVNGNIIQIARAKNSLSQPVLKSIIQSLALSHLQYCTNVWSTASKRDLDKLEKSIRFAEKVCQNRFKPARTICEESLRCLNAKIVSKSSSDYLNNCPTRNSRGNSIKPLVKTNAGKHTVAFRTVLK